MAGKYKLFSRILVGIHLLTTVTLTALLTFPTWVHTEGTYEFSGNLFKVTDGKDTYNNQRYSVLREAFCTLEEADNFAQNSCEIFKRLEHGMYLMIGAGISCILLNTLSSVILTKLFKSIEPWYALISEAIVLITYTSAIASYQGVSSVSYHDTCINRLCPGLGATLAMSMCIIIALQSLFTALVVFYEFYRQKSAQNLLNRNREMNTNI